MRRLFPITSFILLQRWWYTIRRISSCELWFDSGLYFCKQKENVRLSVVLNICQYMSFIRFCNTKWEPFNKHASNWRKVTNQPSLSLLFKSVTMHGSSQWMIKIKWVLSFGIFFQEMIQNFFFLLHGLNFGQISNTVVLICDRMVKAPVELWAERSPTLIIPIVFYSRMYWFLFNR